MLPDTIVRAGDGAVSQVNTTLLSTVGQNWWTVALRGVVAVLFGVLAFVWPGLTLFVLVTLFAAYAFVDGVFALVGAVRAAEDRRSSWPLLLEGFVGVAAGIVAFTWPDITAVVLLYLIAAWAILTGAFELFAAVKLRDQIENERWLALGGIASVIFGLLLFALPGSGALAVIWLIGAYAVTFGVSLIAFAVQLRRWQTGERQTEGARWSRDRTT